MEKCFHKNVRYLVTGRHKVDKKSTEKSPATLSPNTPEGGVGVAKDAGMASHSPLEGPKSKAAQPVALGTRGAKMLAESVRLEGKLRNTTVTTSRTRQGSCPYHRKMKDPPRIQ